MCEIRILIAALVFFLSTSSYALSIYMITFTTFAWHRNLDEKLK